MSKQRKPKLSKTQVRLIRELYKHSSCSMARVARHYEISEATVAKVINETYPYNYKS